MNNDLDARVAALMEKFTAYRYLRMYELEKHKAEFEQALRAELQKPALHEPVTDAEVNHAIGVYLENRRVPYLRGVSPYTADIRAVLESFLQGRAKPKQKEPQRSRASEPTLFSRALDRASKVEKT